MQYSITQLTGQYKSQGRVTIKNNVLLLDYSACGIEFEAIGGGRLAVTFTAYAVKSGALGGCYFTVWLDGVRLPRTCCHITEVGVTTVVLAENLPQGNHTVEIYRQTEGEWARIGISAVEWNGRFRRPTNAAHYIEFVGDSITTAFGNLVENGNETFRNPIWQDATMGYAFLTAKALGVDFSTVARQGIGASVGWQPVPMQVAYPYRCHHADSTELYDFARQPDVVVIALATNDMTAYDNEALGNHKTLAEVAQGFAEFLRLIREKNPKAKIVWAHGMMLSSADDMIARVIEEAGGAAEGYYHVMLPRNNDGGQGHPYHTGHAEMAEVLTEFLKNLL